MVRLQEHLPTVVRAGPPAVKLTDEQLRILQHSAGALRIAAGAGTGKTDTLRRLVATAIQRGAPPEEILCLTFTVEATKEMRRRVLDELGDRSDIDPDEITVQTYHAFAASIVREHALLLGLNGDATLLDLARQWQLMFEALDECTFDQLEIGWLPTFIGKALELNEEMTRHLVAPNDVREWCRRAGDDVSRQREEALQVVECYTRLKRERNAIDFGDQIALAVRVLDRRDVLERITKRYRYVFLDEYQDTDVAQRELVKRIGATASFVCAVGDVDQGIFGWRGATIHNMFAFPDDFAGTQHETLSVNFRSAQGILDLANELIRAWQRPSEETRAELRAHDESLPTTIEGLVSAHQLDEAEEIARRIKEAGPPWSQYAVLSRTRTNFDPIYRALVAAGVPVEVDTLGGFWTRPEILDVLAWLRVLADPGDNPALTRLLLGPAYRLGRRDLFFLADRAKAEKRGARHRLGDRDDLLEYALADAIVQHRDIAELSEAARARVDAFRATWRELARIASEVSLADLVGEVARVSGLAGELAASPNPEAVVALRHLAKLRDLAHAYQPVAGSLDLEGFVAYLNTREDAEQDEDELRAAEPNAVRLLTLHRAKGLEWEVVFLPALVHGTMPHPGMGANNPGERWHRLPFGLRGDREFLPPPPTTKGQLDQLRDEEERRLMYVGVTRAKRRLVLSRAWFYRDNIKPKEPSEFWNEAVATGLVRVQEARQPTENPYPLGIEEPPEPERRFEPPSPDPVEVTRLEREVERLHAVEEQRPPGPRWVLPTTLSVTAFLTFVRDEQAFFDRYVRRLPAPPSPAAQLGIELHRRIELHARSAAAVGALPEPEREEPYDLDASENDGDAADPVTAEQMWENYLKSRFSKQKPLMTEQPFTLYVGRGISVVGRIDAIYEREDGVWEIVDFKSGKSAPDPLQLALYTRAVEEIWGKRADPRWLLLRDGRETQSPARDDEMIEEAVRGYAAHKSA
jgi:ATP-dependent DNA helicase UvrD/PcrA